MTDNARRKVIIDLPDTRPNKVPLPFAIARVGSTERREQDLYMLKNPQHWPHAKLALKRYVHATPPGDDQAPLRVSVQTLAGMEFATWDGHTLVYDTLVFQPVQRPAMSEIMTPEAVVAAGWTVD